MVAIDTVLLKVASRCNLDCDYCYVYHMGDEGWLRQPKRMSRDTVAAVARQLAALAASQQFPFSVVMHGGEPLLAGHEGIAAICGSLRDVLPTAIGLHLQTNGTLLDGKMIDILAACDVGISISLDGPADIHDRHRIDRRGQPSHDRVMQGIRNIRAHPQGGRLFTGVLAVVDLAGDPLETYEFLKEIGAPSIDFLYRDGNHDVLPVGKAGPLSTEYGDWMCRLLDAYLIDAEPTPIRVLDDMLKLIFGGRARKEGVGTDSYGIVVIDTDGSVNKNDTLKSAFGAADRFTTRWNVHEHKLVDIVAEPDFVDYHHSQLASARQCLECPELAVCGGGMPTHRWSAVRGFDNPSVFCADQKALIAHMRDHLRRGRLAA